MKNVVLTSKNDKPLKGIEKTNAIHEHTRNQDEDYFRSAQLHFKARISGAK